MTRRTARSARVAAVLTAVALLTAGAAAPVVAPRTAQPAAATKARAVDLTTRPQAPPGLEKCQTDKDDPEHQVHCYVSTDMNKYLEKHKQAFSVGAWIDQDTLGPTPMNAYSIAQLQIGDVGLLTRYIEYGWIVSPGNFGDYEPHLFLALRKLGKSCIITEKEPKPEKGCPKDVFAYHPQAAVHFGDKLKGSGSHLFQFASYKGNWWVQYEDKWVGHVLASKFWTWPFTSGNVVAWQGEISMSGTTLKDTCVPMGNGNPGNQGRAAKFSSMYFKSPEHPGPTTAEAEIPHADAPDYWSYGAVQSHKSKDSSGVHGFAFGGPGKCR